MLTYLRRVSTPALRAQSRSQARLSLGLRKRVLYSTTADPASHTGVHAPYDHLTVEAKWQAKWKEWAQSNTHLADKIKEKYYSLAMFPYPSGNLHMGHARVYTISDTASRMQRMQGKKVLHPMGWDAFGLPAENAAIERNIKPHHWTMQNIEHMKKQLLQMGFHFDWTQETATCAPEYYKWTQWIFLRLFQRGLAYQKESYVNWDPVDQTVLANEQVDAEGKSWRSGAVVEKKLMRQWYLKLTQYTEPLLKDLDKLEGWPDKVKKMQKEWIGKTTGAHITFNVAEVAGEKIEVFTTRPDTIFGCTYVVLAPEHPLVNKLVPDAKRAEVTEFSREAMRGGSGERMDPSRPKKGIQLGVHVKHPITGELLPVLVGDYVLADYATGAVMGVPAHDARDFQFAKQYSLQCKPVVEGPEGSQLPYTGSGKLINSGKFSGMPNTQAIGALIKEAEANGWGSKRTIYNLRDWLVSRQRYWGTPIPIIHCEKCGVVPVPEKDLPVVLPVEGVNFKGKGSPLAEMKSFVETECPCCGGKARRETDTMDTFVDSAWYFLRYPDALNTKEPFSVDVNREWMPVDVYVGGVEHAILHLLYSRFITKFLHTEGLVPSAEPFTSLKTQGMVHGKTFRLPGSDRPIPPDQVDDFGERAVLKGTEKELSISWEKMSKSKYNGIDPEKVVTEYGADTVRLFLLFKAPIEQVLDWDSSQIQGQLRWLRRLWTLIQTTSKSSVRAPGGKLSIDEIKLRKQLQEAIRDNTKEMQDFSFNTCIARLMKLSNSMTDLLNANGGNIQVSEDAAVSTSHSTEGLVLSPIFMESLLTLLRLLYPMAPHFTSEAWQIIHQSQGKALNDIPHISESGWPTYDASQLVDDSPVYNIHVGGSFRATLELEPEVIDNEEKLLEAIIGSKVVSKWISGKPVKKLIVAKARKVVNLVV